MKSNTGKRAINFLGLTKKTKVISFLLIILSIVVLGVKRSDSLGIEFAGGQQLRFNAAENATEEGIKQIVNNNLSENSKTPQIQKLTPVGQDKTIFSVRVSDTDGENVKKALSSSGLADGQTKANKYGHKWLAKC